MKVVFDATEQTARTGSDSIWRIHLRPTAAGGPYNITFSTSSGEARVLSDVVFGDVFICGGQSNMEFSLGGNENAAAYAKEANSARYHNVRLFTVGQGTRSSQPLKDLATVEQKWARASSKSLSDGSPFTYFSAVCWFFGKGVHDGLGGSVPIGLISNNWGGTKVEMWMPQSASLPCGHASDGRLYNAMIAPYAVGPMALTGFTWYQGEADLGGDPALPDQNNNYTCTQAAMIEQWRQDFNKTHGFYGIVQLSTWIPHSTAGNLLLAQLRDQQLATEQLVDNFAYATNADFGAGAIIHPPYKQHCGARLANAALSMVYGRDVNWRSPTYASAVQSKHGELTAQLNDVVGEGLVLKGAHNAVTAGDCTALNAKIPLTCAWAALQFDDQGRSWVNASIALSVDGRSMVLKAAPPAGATRIVASSYGWGGIPILSVYRADMEGEDGQLPVLPWNRTISPPTEREELVVV